MTAPAEVCETRELRRKFPARRENPRSSRKVSEAVFFYKSGVGGE
jgi:hypothetical protein